MLKCNGRAKKCQPATATSNSHIPSPANSPIIHRKEGVSGRRIKKSQLNQPSLSPKGQCHWKCLNQQRSKIQQWSSPGCCTSICLKLKIYLVYFTSGESHKLRNIGKTPRRSIFTLSHAIKPLNFFLTLWDNIINRKIKRI